MTGRLLDVSTLPFDQVYVCEDGSRINLRDFLDRHRVIVEALAAAGLVKSNESFGFAMTQPFPKVIGEDDEYSWDEPSEFVWFVGGWGPDRDRYIANAIRKLRPLLRNGASYDDPLFSTLDIRFYQSDFFADRVDSQDDDGNFPWGDFPWGGAVLISFDETALVGAVSGLSEIEDDFVVKLILGGVIQLIVRGDGLLAD